MVGFYASRRSRAVQSVAGTLNHFDERRVSINIPAVGYQRVQATTSTMVPLLGGRF
jgi:hypothetical protein